MALLLLLLLPTLTSSQSTDLLVEGLVSPLALDTPNPRFSWELPGQYSYRILTSLSPALDTVLWDSGEVISPVTSQHVYQGPPLGSDTDVWWVVSTTTSPTSPPANSTVSRFTMGLLTPSAWNGARWVGGYNQLKKNFTLPPAPLPTRARVYVTGVGFYELYVNGMLVSNDTEGRPTLFNPGFSTIYSTRVLYNAYDILPYLLPGDNVVGLRLGSGKYGYLGEFCIDGPKVCNSGILSLSLTPSLLLPTPLVTDGSWVGLPSPILTEDLYNGEVVDGRIVQEQEGWSAPSSLLPGWAPVTVRPTPPTATLSASAMPGIVEYTQATTPALLLPVTGVPNSFTWDLGLNGAGRCTLELNGPTPPGLNLTLTLGEILRPGDNSVNVAFHCPNACCNDGGNCANQSFTYITRGTGVGGTESYTPTFAYSGFRYAQIIGWPPSPAPPPTLSSLQCTQTSTGVKGRGSVSFNASTPTGATLNAIQTIILRSQRSNLASIPTDCPQREKRGWMADASVTADEASLNFFMEGVYTNWLRTHSDTSAVGCGPLEKNWTCPKWHSDQPGAWALDAMGAGGLGEEGGEVPNCYICCQGRPGFGCEPNTPTDTAGSIGDVIPFDKNGYGSFPGSIGWTSASFVVAGVLLKAYASVEGLRGVYPGLAAHWKFYNRNAAANDPSKLGLVYWDAYGDWNGLEKTNSLFMANSYYFYDSLLLAEVALAVDEPLDALTYLALASTLSGVLPAHYLNASNPTFWDQGSQAAQSMGIAFGLGASPEAAANLTRSAGVVLAASVASHGGHLTTGTLGSRWLFQALSMSGQGEVAVALAAITTPPSVGAMTVGLPGQPPLGTLWEGWDGPVASPGSSGNHIMMAGGIGEWFYSHALGLSFTHRMEGGGGNGGSHQDCQYPPTPLATNLAVTHGLTPSELCVLGRVTEEVRREGGAEPGVLTLFSSLQARVKRALKEQQGRAAPTKVPLNPPRRLVAHAQMRLDAGIVRALGSAQGWISTARGVMKGAWEWSKGAGLTVNVTVPTNLGAPLSLYLPLTLPGKEVAGEEGWVEQNVSVSVGGVAIWSGTVLRGLRVISGVPQEGLAWWKSAKEGEMYDRIPASNAPVTHLHLGLLPRRPQGGQKQAEEEGYVVTVTPFRNK